MNPRSIVLDNSSSNLVYGNNFYDGGGGPYDSSTANSWSRNGFGNYWNIHQAGTPFRILPNGSDNYPLSNPVKITPVSVAVAIQPASAPFTGPKTYLDVKNSTSITKQQTTMATGSINIESGGRLQISNSTLALGTMGPFNFNIAAGGNLIINRSTIVGGNGVFVSQGGSLTISGSTIFVGQNQTFQINFDGQVKIDRSSIISKGAFGFYFENRGGGSNDTLLQITNSKLKGLSTFWQLGGSLESFHGKLVLDGTTVTGALKDIDFTGNSAEVVNDTFIGSHDGVTISSPSITFSGNHLIDSEGVAASLTGNNIIVKGNTLLGTWDYGINVQGSGGTFIGNTILNPVPGKQISAIGVNGNSETVRDNTIVNSAFFINGVANLVYHNNFINLTSPPKDTTGRNSWSLKGEGNYWSDYAGKDTTLDGIGDTPYTDGNIIDSYPFMKPNGWITRLYLTLMTNLPAMTPFSINGSSFAFGSSGTANLRLGYVASYSISLPQSVTLANGSSMVFAKWSDGISTPTRTVALSSNTTLGATYDVVTVITTTATITSTTTTTATVTSTSTVTTTSPFGVNLTAFPTRFVRICRTRRPSTVAIASCVGASLRQIAAARAIAWFSMVKDSMTSGPR
jgi:parallel beta-helix repeat protein